MFTVNIKNFRKELSEKFQPTGRWIRKTQYADVLVEEKFLLENLNPATLSPFNGKLGPHCYQWRIRFNAIAFKYQYSSLYPGLIDGKQYSIPELAAWQGMWTLHEISKSFGAQPTAKPKLSWILDKDLKELFERSGF